MKTLHILFASAAVFGLGSCGYDTIADADYPAQRVYLAASTAGNIFSIESIPTHSSNTPTEGAPFRFTVDADNDGFNVPLAVYRAGIDNAGDVTTRIAFNSDTVSSLISAGMLPGVELLPADKIGMPSEVRMRDGASHATFEVKVSLSYLLQKAPAGKFAFGLNIAESTREINTDYSALVVMIDTKIMVPTARFSFKVDANDWDRIHFTNDSENIVASEWQFGDGSVSDKTSPSHVYEKEGVYEVVLTTTGVSGEKKTHTVQVPVLHIEKIDRSGWKIVDFSTEEPAEGNGNGLAKAAIDGNVDTFWHTQWSGATPGYPHYLTVDMGVVYTVANVQCVRRQGDSRGQTECQILLSLNGAEWIDCGYFAVADTDAAQTYTMPTYEKARYIRYVATKGSAHFAFLAEIAAYGSKEE